MRDEDKYNGGFVISPERVTAIEDKLEELFERVENIEKQIKEDKEEQIKKLEAEIEYSKFRQCALPYFGGIGMFLELK